MPFIITFFISLFLCLTTTSEGSQTKKTIGIFALKIQGLAAWDPDSIKTGIAGSEEAIIYISQELAKMGYDVTVFADPPAGSKFSDPKSNPRFIDLDRDDGRKFDIAISWRIPNRGIMLKKRAGLVYLWPHDVLWCDVPDSDINSYDDIFWLSESQRQQWISKCPNFQKFTNLYGNGINPAQFKAIKNRKNPYSCIYGSNYARGLEILLNNWQFIKEKYPLATLDIYYGWETWGWFSPEKEAKMRQKVNDLAILGVTEHGRVGHEELNQAYANASFWTYPCILPETFCITALRAQFSGAIPVIIDGSALVETVRHGYRCDHPNKYIITLFQAMDDAKKIPLNKRMKMGEFIKNEYTWTAIAKKWERQFDQNNNKKEKHQ